MMYLLTEGKHPIWQVDNQRRRFLLNYWRELFTETAPKLDAKGEGRTCHHSPPSILVIRVA